MCSARCARTKGLSAFSGLQRREETGVAPPLSLRLKADFVWTSLLSSSLKYEDVPRVVSEQRGCFDVGFSEDGALVVGCMEDATVRLLDCRQGGMRRRCVAVLRSHLDAVHTPHHTNTHHPPSPTHVLACCTYSSVLYIQRAVHG